MSRVYNFSAGPSMLPDAVLKRAADEMFDYHGSGQSVMEMSHRSKIFDDIIRNAEKRLRELMEIPENYKTLFLQGGATTQFAAIPLNFLSGSKKADYVVTGHWAEQAFHEAEKYGDIKLAASSADRNYSYIPKLGRDDFRQDADYVHICMNNTIHGTLYHEMPDTGKVPLIADISSCMVSEPIDVTRFAMLYGGAQKNAAPAGVSICIIREDMLGHARADTPTMLNYKVHADRNSIYNTPPCYAIYVCGLLLEWISAVGGLKVMKERNERKAKLLYDFLDGSRLFRGTADKEDRSLMNVHFVTGSAELDAKFVLEAAARGLINLKGHRTTGGIRASIYNAMPYEGVEKLVEFMAEFEKANS